VSINIHRIEYYALRTYRRWWNSADSEDPEHFVQDVTADLPEVRQRNAARVGIRCTLQNLSDEDGLLIPLELLNIAEVPDGSKLPGCIIDEIVLTEDLAVGFGEGFDEFLDRGISHHFSTVPDLEEVFGECKYAAAVGHRNMGYVDNLGNRSGGSDMLISLDRTHSHAKQTRTGTCFHWCRYSSEHQKRPPQQREEYWGVRGRLAEQKKAVWRYWSDHNHPIVMPF